MIRTQGDHRVTVIMTPWPGKGPSMGKHGNPDQPQDRRGDPKDNGSQHPSPHSGGGEKTGT